MAKRGDSTVLFLGAGNDSRSRFAAAFFNSVASKMGLPWQASSRELDSERNVPDDGPTAVAAVAALTSLGVRGAEAVTRPAPQVTADDFQQAALLVALTHAEHPPLLRERFLAWADKAEFWDADDGPEALALVERTVMNLVARLFGGGGRPETPARETPSPARQPDPEPPRKALTAKVGRETAGRRGKGRARQAEEAAHLTRSEQLLAELGRLHAAQRALVRWRTVAIAAAVLRGQFLPGCSCVVLERVGGHRPAAAPTAGRRPS